MVAGLMLMASLMVGILVACGRHIQQTERAKKRLHAVSMADQLLTNWFSNPDDVLEVAESPPTESGLYWKLQPVEGRELPDVFGAKIVRLEIWDADSPDKQTPLVAVELVRSNISGDSTNNRMP